MPIIGPGIAFAAASRQFGVRFDPYGAYNFHVEIQGLVAGGFSEVSGLSMETGVETFREGGVNEFEYKLPKGTSYSNLVLKRGLIDVDLLWGWYQNVIEGKIQRRNLTIFLLDHQGLPAMWWDIFKAYPIQWEGPSLDASSSTVAVQQLTIVYQHAVRPGSSIAFSAARGALANLPGEKK